MPSSKEPSNPPTPDAPPEAPPRRRWRPPDVSGLGVATAGVGLVLAVLGLASLLINRGKVSALDARPAGVELELRELGGKVSALDARLAGVERELASRARRLPGSM